MTGGSQRTGNRQRDVPDLVVAGIGAGYFSRFHYDAWQRIEHCRLIAVADVDLSRARAVGVGAYDDPARMLRELQPDVVDIVSPPETHFDMIALAIEAGAKAIICQKPFCGDLETAGRAVALAETAAVPLIVHENFRFQPWYRRIREEIASGRLGEVLQVTFRLRPGDGQGQDAYLDRQPYFRHMPRFLLHETGVHWIDTFRFLLGEPSSVYADLRRLNPAVRGEDAGYFVFGYDNGARALFDGNRLLDHAAADRRLTMGECYVEGTGGEIRLLGDGGLAVREHGAAAWRPLAEPPESKAFGGDCVAALQRHVVAGLLHGETLENQAAPYLRNMRIESALYESAERGRRIELNS
ncbi:Gfo/Idh/MocA family protein [Oceanibacterium hippocampi]|uniref:Putative oxidoreductase YcjS n=1 Tax=Oceanibacterium hippocampi TaxID=745714 RepID=A0A1Y5TIU5_9PROT|nr:Gfo/Idh/MocA family oxidoreductase [Oceanibacterium hippocampi]SLN65152.1 putative oxidoreductase YcjS [Oceanibacterium hippocampi]